MIPVFEPLILKEDIKSVIQVLKKNELSSLFSKIKNDFIIVNQKKYFSYKYFYKIKN